ncbi:MAG: hypothetical protein ABIN91_18465 [Mucilaginibacter sp.]|uniref:hypothetical protein n=1 Tax=Mucilaginibacter sp. TaxID=1882438 RepID=UPI0032638D3E
MKIRLVLSIAVIASCLNLKVANAQEQQEFNSTNIMPVLNHSYTNVEGSPFLTNQWAKGTVKMANGHVYKDMQLKYEQCSDAMFFRKTNDEDLFAFSEQISEVKMDYIQNNIPYQKLYRTGYTITGSTEKSFFEVLSDGRVQLLKKDNKIITESKEYNSSTINKKFEPVTKYYIVIAGNVKPFKKDKKFILANLSDKQTQIENYIKTNDLDLKNDADLAMLFNYYNSI